MSGVAEGIPGLTLSAISVAALFATCIDCFNLFAAATNFERDYELLWTALAIQKLRLLLWGESVGLASRHTQSSHHHPGLDEPMVNSVLVKTLQSIQQLLTETRDLNNHYDRQRSAPLPQQRSRGLGIFRSSFEEFDLVVHREQKQKSLKNATRWAIHDAEKFKVTVERLRSFMDGLHDITRSLGVLSDQQARLKEEIESVSDRESLQLIRDAAGQENVANVARQKLQQSHTASPVEFSRPADSATPLMQKVRGIPSLDVLAERRSSAGAHRSKDQILTSTPDSFPKLFPSSETLFLQHDNEIVDGNLALCVATATDRGCGPRVQLFYLRMKDIKRREFSLRRHNRVSGQEVCFTSRVYRTKVRRRTRVCRSISSSMSSLQSMSSGRRSSISSQASATGLSQPGADVTTYWQGQQNQYQITSGDADYQGSAFLHTCTCCPRKPKQFDTLEELRAHESKKPYHCQFCNNNYKSKNELERHQNSLHPCRQSWSCAILANDYKCAFHSGPSTSHKSHNLDSQLAVSAEHKPAVDICGYCGNEFTDVPTLNWEDRITHLDIHNFGKCNLNNKKFFRADHFRQHLKHSHAATSGRWTNQLEFACMKFEVPILDHDGMGQQHHGGLGTPSNRRDSSPELVTEQQQGELGVPSRRRNTSPEPTNKVSLAFSNYAHVEISRTGIGKNRNYEFEYWGTNYI